jgi:hypothetical protein
MKNNSSIYQKFLPKILPKKFPEINGVKVWTYKRGVFSFVYVIDIYFISNFEIENCENYIIEIGAEIESLLKYFNTNESLDIRLHNSDGKVICKGSYYKPNLYY